MSENSILLFGFIFGLLFIFGFIGGITELIIRLLAKKRRKAIMHKVNNIKL